MNELTKEMIRNAGAFELTQLKAVYSGKELEQIIENLVNRVIELSSEFKKLHSAKKTE